MNFPFYVARRYLFSKKSHHAINIISAISVCGVALATMALVCTLSVFNGFQDLVASFFTAIDPQLEVAPAKGKTMAADAPGLTRLKAYPGIQVYTETLEENALVICGDHQAMVTIKGVDDNFAEATDIGSLLYGDGTFILHADVLEFGVPGIQLAAQLGLGARFDTPLQVYAPKKGERVNPANPSASFTQSELYSPGVVFAVKQEKYDAHYILTSLGFARNLFGQQGRVSSIALKLKEGTDVEQARKDIQQLLGPGFTVEDRYAQQADVFRIMEVEKLIAYLFLTFILLVACFNIIGSVSMLIIDKKDDVRTLRNLGAKDHQVIRIFLFEGRLISGAGALAGILLPPANLRVHHAGQILRQLRGRRLPRQRAALGCGAGVFHRAAGRLLRPLVSRALSGQTAAGLKAPPPSTRTANPGLPPRNIPARQKSKDLQRDPGTSLRVGQRMVVA